ncbi:MAG: YgjV family protein, partial [Clostridia bacterium]|nr:YgjV family protein [Clostridia bacterium]
CLYIVTVIFTYESLVSILLLIAQIVGTYAMWFGDGKRIRTLQLCVVSPIWLLNNILVFTIGGIIAEVFTIASAIISFFRYRKTGFEK